jgi:putative transposase
VACKNLIDEPHTENPTWGSRQLSKQLKKRDYNIGRLKTRRFMNEMDIDVIYPKRNLSKRNQANKIYPYLLRNITVNRANQAWSIDYSDKKVIPTFTHILDSIRMFLRNIGITFRVTLNHITV